MLKLRKRTGYSFVNCRKALLKFGDQNIKDAEKWLKELAKKEGWEKAAKVGNRSTSQGLYGVLAAGNLTAVVALNCETDFVAKNREFKELLESLVSALFHHAENLPAPTSEDKATGWKEYDVVPTDVTLEGGISVKEAIALAIGKLGENITLASFKVFRSPSTTSSLFAYAHPKEGTAKVEMGRFISIIGLERTVQGGFPSGTLAQQICQHIIGMNPKTLGTPPTAGDEHTESQGKKAPADEDTHEEEEDELNAFTKVEHTVIDEDEDRLLRQAFMLNPSQTIHKYLSEHGAKVTHFVRLEHGGEEDD